MAGVAELASLLSAALDAEASDCAAVAGLLASMCGLLAGSSNTAAAAELDELIFDLHGALVRAAELCPEAEARVRQLLALAAQQCTAREVFTLGMATLAQQLSRRHESSAPPAPLRHGPASPAFHLFLLSTLQQCLPRIRRRPLHFLGELLHMQLRWAEEVLPSLPLGDAAAAADAADATASGAAACEAGADVTAAAAASCLAGMAAATAAWVQSSGGSHSVLPSAAEQSTARRLLTIALLQLAGTMLQLPQALAAAPAAAQAAQLAPALGSRLPLMEAAAKQLALLPLVLLRQVPADPDATAGAGSSSADGYGSPEELLQLALSAERELAECGLDPFELPCFSSQGVAAGAAVAACTAAWQPGAPPAQLRGLLQQVLPQAAALLLDLGAQHQSVALTLLPLYALCAASRRLVAGSAGASAGGKPRSGPDGGGGSGDNLLSASSSALDLLTGGLVSIMGHNPVQLVRSCAHDAVQALLDAFEPEARLAQLRAMVQMPSTAAAVVALQRLRQEMAAAWTSEAVGGAAAAAAGSGSPWLSEAALQLALPCLERGGSEAGWHDERSVLERADVQAAALSLLRWALLREAAAPRGLLPPRRARALAERDLAPLKACVARLLRMQAGLRAASADSGGVEEQQLLDSFLAVQRLEEALDRVLDLTGGPGSSS